MGSSIVLVLVAAGFLAGLTSGAFAAYRVLAVLGNIEGAIHEVAKQAGPF